MLKDQDLESVTSSNTREELVDVLKDLCPVGEMRFMAGIHNWEQDKTDFWIGRSASEYQCLMDSSVLLVTDYMILAHLTPSQQMKYDHEYVLLDNASPSAWQYFRDDWDTVTKTVKDIDKIIR